MIGENDEAGVKLDQLPWHVGARVGEPRQLAQCVRELSDAYNAEKRDSCPPTDDRRLLAARLQFSFPRDIAKSAEAVRELSLFKLIGPQESKAQPTPETSTQETDWQKRREVEKETSSALVIQSAF